MSTVSPFKCPVCKKRLVPDDLVVPVGKVVQTDRYGPQVQSTAVGYVHLTCMFKGRIK